jgi:ATP-dependent RNA helicase DeaD
LLFTELGLKESSLKAIEKLGYTTPTEIQVKSIPLLLEKDIDFIGQAQTGTGKTAAFVLPLLEKIDLAKNEIQALIIAPTRELANQIQEEIDKLSCFEKARSVSVYGGTSVSGQIREIKQTRPQIVAGTPGRLIDMIERGVLKLETVKYVVLDEADEMLDMGFFDDVQEIVSHVDESKLWMFSATMPKPILDLVNRHFKNPEMVKIKKEFLTSDAVKQQYVMVHRENMAEAVCRFLDFNQDVYAIVFCRTKLGAKELADELNARGYPSDALHGDMSQDQRDLTMKKFKEKKINLLICTDVAARGIDVSDLTHVINFGLPQDNESYVHRIGRTGRGGKQGVALSIIEKSEGGRIAQIERITKAKIERIALPKVDEIKAVLLEKSFNQFSELLNGDFENEMFTNFKNRFENLEKDQLMKGLYAFIFQNSFKRYLKAQDIDIAQRSATSNNATAGFDRFFVAIGREDRVQVPDMLKYFSRMLRMSGNEIGKVDLKDRFSFIEIPSHYREAMLELSGFDYNNRAVSVELSQSNVSSGAGRSFGGGGRSRNSSFGGRSSGGGYNRGGGNYAGSGDRSGNRSHAPRSSAGARRSSHHAE